MSKWEDDRTYIVESAPAPVDWPARFRNAADEAEKADDLTSGGMLRTVGAWLRVKPPHVVEAIGRALTGESS